MGLHRYKTIETEVEVEMDDFSNEELIDEVIYRKKKGKFDNREISRLAIGTRYDTMEDKMKTDWLHENWHKFNSFDLEKLLK